ncbi:MAG: dihydropteroate synthase [Actinobacteria bacterium]|nr:MAG: dihydropteroate synthase [Actinomycetota bacterium]
MGVLNVTPDSFSDGGLYLEESAALAHGRELVAQGADLVDVGGESTRPGAEPVAPDLQRVRVVPVIARLSSLGAATSVDSSSVAVAEAAIAAGARLVNDVTAFRAEPEMAGLVADRDVDCCLMHMQGEPRTMQRNPRYGDVVDDVKAFLAERLEFAVREGVGEHRVLLDPGIGFGKTPAHNLELIDRLDELLSLGRPLVVGTSRKSFLGRLVDRPVGERLPGTIATNVLALERGASVFRVHDVQPVRDALITAQAALGARHRAGATVRRPWRPRPPAGPRTTTSRTS